MPTGVARMSSAPHQRPCVASISPTMPTVTDDSTRTRAAPLRRNSRRVRRCRGGGATRVRACGCVGEGKGPGEGFDPSTTEPQSDMLTKLHYPGQFGMTRRGVIGPGGQVYDGRPEGGPLVAIPRETGVPHKAN